MSQDLDEIYDRINYIIFKCFINNGVDLYSWQIKRREYWNSELHYLFIGLYFGLYTLIDLLFNQRPGADPIISFVVLLHVCFSLIITMIFFQLLYNNFLQRITFIRLSGMYLSVNPAIVSIVVLSAAIFNIYILVQYGFLAGLSEDVIQMAGLSVPSSIGPMKVFFNGLLYGAFIYFLLRIISGKKTYKSDIFYFSVIVILIVLGGRRSFVNLLIVSVFFWSVENLNRIYSARNIKIAAISIIVFVLFSNAFQTYRNSIFQAGIYNNANDLPGIIDALSNFQESADNLSTRTAMWRFNYLIAQRQINDNFDAMLGEIGFQALKNSIPGILVTKKEVFDTDFLIAQHYQLDWTDYPTNNFATLMADFGLMSIIFYPIILALILVAYSLSVKISSTYALFAGGMIVNYFISIENSPGDFYILFRDIFILVIFLIGVKIFALFLKFLFCLSPRLQKLKI